TMSTTSGLPGTGRRLAPTLSTKRSERIRRSDSSSAAVLSTAPSSRTSSRRSAASAVRSMPRSSIRRTWIRALPSCAAVSSGATASVAATSHAWKSRALPAAAEAYAENRVLVRSLERMRIEELERQRSEQYRTRCETGAPDRHTLFAVAAEPPVDGLDRKSTRLNSSHVKISYAVFCLKKKKK